MELAIAFANNFLILLDAMAIYILIGLLLTGILKQLVPDNFVLKARLFGIPLPNIDSILATFSFFGLIFTVFRVVTSIIIAITVGLVQNFEALESSESSVKSSLTSTVKKQFSFKKAFSYAYGTLFKDMAKPLFIGLLLGAVFTTFTPREYTSMLFENQILTYFIIMIFSMPLYVCATASLPIVAALVLQGMSGGAALIFLTVGLATNAITMSVIYKTLGRTSLIINISIITVLSIIFAFIYDYSFANINIINFSKDINESSLVSQIASFIMLGLMSYYLIKSRLLKKENKFKV